jgi:hypothetical protein
MLLQPKSYIGVASPMDWFTRSIEIVDLIENCMLYTSCGNPSMARCVGDSWFSGSGEFG